MEAIAGFGLSAGPVFGGVLYQLGDILDKGERKEPYSLVGFIIPFVYCFLTSAIMVPIALKVVPAKPKYIKEKDDDDQQTDTAAAKQSQGSSGNKRKLDEEEEDQIFGEENHKIQMKDSSLIQSTTSDMDIQAKITQRIAETSKQSGESPQAGG